MTPDLLSKLNNIERAFVMHCAITKRMYNHATVVLPYITEMERTLADSIAKKTHQNKFFRGPRRGGSLHYKPSRTLKEDAVAVALYHRC
jgi:hypothetical protein